MMGHQKFVEISARDKFLDYGSKWNLEHRDKRRFAVLNAYVQVFWPLGDRLQCTIRFKENKAIRVEREIRVSHV